jgi:hypothetical protein
VKYLLGNNRPSKKTDLATNGIMLMPPPRLADDRGTRSSSRLGKENTIDNATMHVSFRQKQDSRKLLCVKMLLSVSDHRSRQTALCEITPRVYS